MQVAIGGRVVGDDLEDLAHLYALDGLLRLEKGMVAVEAHTIKGVGNIRIFGQSHNLHNNPSARFEIYLTPNPSGPARTAILPPWEKL